LLQIRDCLSDTGIRVQVMRNDLWLLGVTEVNRNVGMMGLAQKQEFVICRNDYSVPSLFREASRKI
jgi:hypothetical protein